MIRQHMRQALLQLATVVLTVSLAWAEANFPVIATEDLKRLLDERPDQVTVIDAGGGQEFHEVHIKGAISIPEKEFADKAHLLPADKGRQLIFYCNGVKCGKSRKAAQKASELGYGNILVYADGMPVWEEKGMPIYTGPDYEKKIETTVIAPRDLETLLRKGPELVTVVDVRDPEEFQEGHIPGAINIPVATFATQSGTLDKKKTIVVVCNGGGRSYNAYRKLMKLGYEDIRQALLQDWKDQGLAIETSSRAAEGR